MYYQRILRKGVVDSPKISYVKRESECFPLAPLLPHTVRWYASRSVHRSCELRVDVPQWAVTPRHQPLYSHAESLCYCSGIVVLRRSCSSYSLSFRPVRRTSGTSFSEVLFRPLGLPLTAFRGYQSLSSTGISKFCRWQPQRQSEQASYFDGIYQPSPQSGHSSSPFSSTKQSQHIGLFRLWNCSPHSEHR